MRLDTKYFACHKKIQYMYLKNISFCTTDPKRHIDITLEANHHNPSPSPMYMYGSLQRDIAKEGLPWHEGISSMIFTSYV